MLLFVGAGAPTAARPLGCSPAHLAVPLIPRHAGDGDGGGWATEECDGRRLPASPEQLEEEERDNAYDKAGFLSFMEYGGADLRQVEVEY